MAIGEAKVLVTTAALYRRKVADWRDELPGLQYVLLIDHGGASPPIGAIDFATAMARATVEPSLAASNPDDLALFSRSRAR
jgi:acetyl-CoA synthetase